jgi:hypothetical protein
MANIIDNDLRLLHLVKSFSPDFSLTAVQRRNMNTMITNHLAQGNRLPEMENQYAIGAPAERRFEIPPPIERRFDIPPPIYNQLTHLEQPIINNQQEQLPTTNFQKSEYELMNERLLLVESKSISTSGSMHAIFKWDMRLDAGK